MKLRCLHVFEEFLPRNFRQLLQNLLKQFTKIAKINGFQVVAEHDILFILWALVVFRGLRLGRRAVIDSVHRGFFVGCGFLRELRLFAFAVVDRSPFFCGSRLGWDYRFFFGYRLGRDSRFFLRIPVEAGFPIFCRSRLKRDSRYG